jgi:hypothetical protein
MPARENERTTPLPTTRNAARLTSGRPGRSRGRMTSSKRITAAGTRNVAKAFGSRNRPCTRAPFG